MKTTPQVDWSSIRCVLFDAVGTLIYPEPPVAEVYAEAAREYGSQLDAAAVKERFRTAYARVFSGRQECDELAERERWTSVVGDVFHDQVTTANADLLLEQLWQHFAQPDSWRLFPDAQATLSRLVESKQIAWAIASNFDARLHSICSGWEELREARLFVSTELGFAKPHPDFYLRVQQQLNVEPASILMVGDDLERDVLAPRELGWQTVRIDRSAPTSERTINSLLELPWSA